MRYYIIINEEYYVDFAQISVLKDLNTYLKLNLFTMCFENEKELVDGLKALKLIPENFEVKSISLARRQNLDSNQFYGITKEIAYSDTLPFMSKTTLINFFLNHRKNPYVISNFVQSYIYDLQEKIEAPSIKDSVKKYFYAKKATLQVLEILSEKPFQNYLLEREEEIEYKERITEFLSLTIDGEGKRNYRELIKIAKYAAKSTKEFSLNNPKYTNQFEGNIKEFKHIIQTLIDLRETERGELKIAKFEFNEDKDFFYIGKPIKDLEEPLLTDHAEDIDPDHYMFLENEDFEQMLKQTNNPKLYESVEADIETLEQRKTMR